MVPELAASSGMDSAMLLNGATAANLIAIPIFLLIGVLYNKFGTRKIHTALMIIPGICLLFFGNTTTYTMYLFLLTILATTTNAVNLSGLPQIYANYFPTKKGLIMGWATSGSAGGAIIALPLLIIPDKPEQMGKRPDNGDITEEELAHLREENETAEPIWTIREALKNKNFWLLAVGYGLMFLLTAGIMMQMVPYQMSQGMEQGKAVATISVVALLGIFGSAFSGWLDQKIGVKRTGILLGVAYALACFFGGVMPYTTVTNVLFIAIYGAFMGSISKGVRAFRQKYPLTALDFCYESLRHMEASIKNGQVDVAITLVPRVRLNDPKFQAWRYITLKSDRWALAVPKHCQGLDL